MTYIDLQDGLGPSTDELVRIHAVIDAGNALDRAIAHAARTAWSRNDAEHILRSIINAWECLQTANEARQANVLAHDEARRIAANIASSSTVMRLRASPSIAIES